MPRQSHALFSVHSLLTASILLYFFASAAQQSSRSRSLTTKPLYRAWIITLMRSDTLVSLNKLLNMLHSLRFYFHHLHRYMIDFVLRRCDEVIPFDDASYLTNPASVDPISPTELSITVRMAWTSFQITYENIRCFARFGLNTRSENTEILEAEHVETLKLPD